MDADIFNILEFLASEGIQKTMDISSELNAIRSKGKRLHDGTDIKNFLDALKPYTNFSDYTSYRVESPYGFMGVKIHITNDGIDALKAERDRIAQRIVNESAMEVDKSAIDVNKSIKATNDAVIDMNKRMLEHADRQEVIMLNQSAFTEKQVSIMERQSVLIDKQNRLYKFTLILTAANIFVAIILCVATVSSNADKALISTQWSQLAEKQKEIKRLQLLKSDTIHYVLHYPKSKSRIKVN